VPAETRSEGPGAGEDRGHLQPAVVGLADLQVVHLGDQASVGVDQLTVEQVQGGVVAAAPERLRHHCPIFVTTISGMAASEASSTTPR
jgi:hypothetical protein